MWGFLPTPRHEIGHGCILKKKKAIYVFIHFQLCWVLAAACRNYRVQAANQLQYSCLENPMGGGAWQATVHASAESWTRRDH